jgi:hypothetical protein
LSITFSKFMTIGFSAIALSTLAIPGQATNLVVNGGFETTTPAGQSGQLGFNNGVFTLSALGWSNTAHGYNFIFTPSSADGAGGRGDADPNNIKLWGPNDGAPSTNHLGPSPNGGNFLAADSDFEVGAITQTVSVVQGQVYSLSFYWGAAQQFGFNGVTTDQWKVKLGNEEHDTAVLTDQSHGFTGWQLQTMTFTAATTGNEVLSFLASGGPSGTVPPFALLDGVSLTAVPEPGALGLMLTGLIAGIGALKLKNRSKR